MAEEFANFLQETRKAPLEEKLNAFGDIVEKIMTIVLKIPDLVDQSIQTVSSKVTTLENQLNNLNRDYNAFKSRSGAVSPTTSVPGGPLGGPPPPPPGGPPGGPPPGPSRPASPQSLRGAIMGELKELFSKRKRTS